MALPHIHHPILDLEHIRPLILRTALEGTVDMVRLMDLVMGLHMVDWVVECTVVTVEWAWAWVLE